MAEDEDLSRKAALTKARAQLAAQAKQSTEPVAQTSTEPEPEPTTEPEPEPVAQTSTKKVFDKQEILSKLEKKLMALSVEEIKQVGQEIADLINRLTDPKYAEMKQKEAERKKSNKELEDIINTLKPEQAEQMRALLAKKASKDDEYFKARLEVEAPKARVRQTKKYLIKGQVKEWSGMGNPTWLKEALEADEEYKKETVAAKKSKRRKAILESLEVKE